MSTRTPIKPDDPCRLRIDYGSCVCCAACVSVCHTMALRMDVLTLELDEPMCDNCSLCVRVCPTGAVFFYKDKPKKAA